MHVIPHENGAFAIGETDVEDFLWQCRGHKVLLILAPLGSRNLTAVCGLCRTPYEGDKCPNCQKEIEEAKRFVGWHRDLFEEIEDRLSSAGGAYDQ